MDFISVLISMVLMRQDYPVGVEPAPRSISEIMGSAPDDAWISPDPDNTLYMDTERGRIVIALSEHLAPAHVVQVKTLAREGYYEGMSFYRVVHGFVAQGGDETGEVDKGSAAEALAAEFEEPMRDDIPFTPLGHADGYSDVAGYIDGMPAGQDEETGSVWLAHCTGAFAFGRENERDSASTEFYITLQPHRYLDRNMTVFGRVLYGMDVVQSFPRGQFSYGGTIADKSKWTRIDKLIVASDLPEEERVPVQYLDTSSDTFRELIGTRAARASAFFHYRHGYMDLCQMPLPVRLVDDEER